MQEDTPSRQADLKLDLSRLAFETIQNTQLIERIQSLALVHPHVSPPIAAIIGSFLERTPGNLSLLNLSAYLSFSEIRIHERLPHAFEITDIKVANRPNNVHRGILGFITIGQLQGTNNAIPRRQTGRFGSNILLSSPDYEQAVNNGMFGWVPARKHIEMLDKRLRAIFHNFNIHEKMGINMVLKNPFLLVVNGSTKLQLDQNERFDPDSILRQITSIPLSIYGGEPTHLPIDPRFDYSGSNAIYIRAPYDLLNGTVPFNTLFGNFMELTPKDMIELTSKSVTASSAYATLAELRWYNSIFAAIIQMNSQKVEKGIWANFNYTGTNPRIASQYVAIEARDEDEFQYLVEAIHNGSISPFDHSLQPQSEDTTVFIF